MCRGGNDAQLGPCVRIPLVQVKAVPHNAGLNDVLAVIKEYGFSRIPVYQGDVANITGVIVAKDLLSAPACRDKPAYAPATWRETFSSCCAQPPSFIRNASPRRASGSASNPDSTTVSRVPSGASSSVIVTSVVGSFE